MHTTRTYRHRKKKKRKAQGSRYKEHFRMASNDFACLTLGRTTHQPSTRCNRLQLPEVTAQWWLWGATVVALVSPARLLPLATPIQEPVCPGTATTNLRIPMVPCKLLHSACGAPRCECYRPSHLGLSMLRIGLGEDYVDLREGTLRRGRGGDMLVCAETVGRSLLASWRAAISFCQLSRLFCHFVCFVIFVCTVPH